MEPTEFIRSASDEADVKRAGRLHQLRTELAIRMQPLCRDLPEALFEELIDQMALTRFRDEELNR